MEENKETAQQKEENTNSGLSIRDQVLEGIKQVYDPEIPVNIYELGLIYEVTVDENKDVFVLMTLTSPACPAAGMIPGDVEEKAKAVPGVNDVKVEITFDPPWDKDMMSDEAKLELGFM
jgi:FeS assembly SUF system protein